MQPERTGFFAMISTGNTPPPTDVFQAPPPGSVPPGASSPVQPTQPASGIPTMQLPPQTPIPPAPPTSQGLGKKKFIFIGIGILLVIILIVAVISFFSSNNSKSEEEGNAELTYWGVYEDPRVMQVLIDEFQRDNPNIKVTFVQQEADQYRNRLMTRIQNGNGPDIFRFHNSWVPTMMGVLLPMSQDAISPEEYEKTYYPVIVSDLVQNGAILGVPLGIDTLAMYTNNQLLSSQNVQPPSDWEEFVKAAGILTTRVQEGDTKGQITTAGTALGTYDNVTHAPDIISLMMSQAGVDLYDITSAGSEEENDGCSLKVCQALSFYTIFAKGDSSVPKVWDGSLENSVTAFANGKVAMYFGYSWDIFTIRSINPSLAFSIYPVPNLVLSNKKTIASYWVEGVSNKTLYPVASMKFMKFLNEKETQQKYFTEKVKVQKIGRPYARQDLAESLKTDPILYPFVLQSPYAVSTPFSSDTHDDGLNTALNEYLKIAVEEVSDNTSPLTAVETLHAGMLQAFNEYVKQ